MNNYRKFFLVLALVTGCFIFYISSQSYPYNPLVKFQFSSYLYHFGIFFLFSLFLFLAGKFEKEYILFVIFFSAFYAGLDEYHQLFVLNRSAAIFDFYIDSLGILTSAFIFDIYNKFIKRS